MEIRVVCAWCGRLIRIEKGTDDKPDDKSSEPLISHGICTDCKDNLFK